MKRKPHFAPPAGSFAGYPIRRICSEKLHGNRRPVQRPVPPGIVSPFHFRLPFKAEMYHDIRSDPFRLFRGIVFMRPPGGCRSFFHYNGKAGVCQEKHSRGGCLTIIQRSHLRQAFRQGEQMPYLPHPGWGTGLHNYKASAKIKNSLINGKGQEILRSASLGNFRVFSYYILTKLGNECIMIVT